MVRALIKDPAVDQQRIDKAAVLEQCNLNAYGFFDRGLRKHKGSKLQAMD